MAACAAADEIAMFGGIDLQCHSRSLEIVDVMRLSCRQRCAVPSVASHAAQTIASRSTSQLTTIGWHRQKPGIPGRLPAGLDGVLLVASEDGEPLFALPSASTLLLCLAFRSFCRSSRRRYGSSLDGGRELFVEFCFACSTRDRATSTSCHVSSSSSPRVKSRSRSRSMSLN
jgi:hypothetical protein